MIQVVIFDMDGLMIDSEPIQSLAFEEVIKSLGNVPQKSLNGLVQTLGITERENWIKLKSQYEIGESVDTLVALRFPVYLELLSKHIQAMPGLYDLLELLKKKQMKLAVASSSRLEIIHAALGAISCESYFDILVSGTEVKSGKPYPDIFLKVASILKVDPSVCIVLEDSENGVIAGQKAGMKVIAVKNQYTAEHDFSLANVVLGSLSEFRNYLLEKKFLI